ncbi:MAG TPA: SRPBCC family protein [Polyangiaceae bacterium]|nr:SRPBCC family protein [Polyangiaceae bacterium]
MAQFSVEEVLPVSPDELWPWLTVPSRMNRWSEATVTLEAAGEDGGPASAGARRRVDLRAFGLTFRMHETVLEARPPERFVYRVMRAPGLKAHRGEITLRAEGAGTRLTWRVEFRTGLPGAEPLFAAVVQPRLLRSVRALAAIVAEGRRP